MRTFFILALAALISAGLFTPWMFGETRGTQTASSIEAPFPLVFPEDFDWGVAVAAQHVEHQQPSDWTAFERRVIRESKTGTGFRKFICVGVPFELRRSGFVLRPTDRSQ